MRRLLVLPLVLLVGCATAPEQPVATSAIAPAATAEVTPEKMAEVEASKDGEYWTPERVAQLKSAKRKSARRSRKEAAASTAVKEVVTAPAAPADLPPAPTTATTAGTGVPVVKQPKPAFKPPKPAIKEPNSTDTKPPHVSKSDAKFLARVEDVFTRLEDGHLTMADVLEELRVLAKRPLTQRQQEFLEYLIFEVEQIIEETSEPSMPDMGFNTPPGIKLPTAGEVQRSLGHS